jgi:hypothetical protein
MGWTFDEIKTDWLGDGVPIQPEAIVAAFERAERVLGKDWIETSRRSNQGGAVIRGIAPTMRVADMGQKLAFLDGVIGNIDRLTRAIARGDSSAEAELTAIYLLRSRNPKPLVELFPRIDGPEPDFRTRLGEEPWTYVEVSQPNKSQAEQATHRVMIRLTESLQKVSNTFSVEVYLRREPDEGELQPLINSIMALSQKAGMLQEELPDGLGMLILNYTAPGQVLKLRIGDEQSPRICVSAIAGDGSKPNRKISVSIPFSDSRAANFLTAEASQLPTSCPGLVALEVSHASGGIKTWAPLLERCFQPDLYSRVSAVCLFDDAVITFHGADNAVLDTRLIVNPHAQFRLPSWIATAVRESAEEFSRVIPQA